MPDGSKKKNVVVYSIAGTDNGGDIRADLSHSASFRNMLRMTPKGLTIRPTSGVDSVTVPSHAGLCSYGGNAFGIISQHLKNMSNAPDEVWVYGHSLGGACAMITSHALRHAYAARQDLKSDMELQLEAEHDGGAGTATGEGEGASADEEQSLTDDEARAALALAQDGIEIMQSAMHGLTANDPIVKCVAFAAPSYVAGDSILSLKKDELGDKLDIRHYTNRGDSVIYNAFTKVWGMTYPVKCSRVAHGLASPSDSSGLTTFGILDAQNDANYPCTRVRFLRPTFADAVRGSRALFTHGNFMDKLGRVCVDRRDLTDARSKLGRFEFEIVELDVGDQPIVAN